VLAQVLEEEVLLQQALQEEQPLQERVLEEVELERLKRHHSQEQP
jgi:hypothetical protein